MGFINTVFDQLRESVALAGGAGAFVRWASIRPREAKELLITIPVGAVSAVYLWPIFDPLINNFVSSGSSTVLAGFVSGTLGISVSGFVVDVFQAWRKKYLNGGDKDNKK